MALHGRSQIFVEPDQLPARVDGSAGVNGLGPGVVLREPQFSGFMRMRYRRPVRPALQAGQG